MVEQKKITNFNLSNKHILEKGRRGKIKEINKVLYEKLSENIQEVYVKDLQAILNEIIELPKKHLIKKYIKKNKITLDQIRREIAIEGGCFLTNAEVKNPSKINAPAANYGIERNRFRIKKTP
jgi:hypothetical protein